MPRRSHKQCQQAHAKRRAVERYGVEVSLKAIRRLIQDGQSLASQKQSLSRTLHLVRYGGEIYGVAYCNKTKTVATVLPQTDRRVLAMCGADPWVLLAGPGSRCYGA